MLSVPAAQTPARHQRRCLFCQRPIKGYGFYTFYGRAVREGKTVHGCGDPVHHICPPADAAPRTVLHDPGLPGASLSRGERYKVAPGVFFNSRTEKYEASSNKTRCGSHATMEDAIAARDEYVRKQRSLVNARYRARHRKEQSHVSHRRHRSSQK